MELTKEQKLFQKIVARAWEDEGFKNKLLTSPVAAIGSVTEERIKVPEGKTLVVCDQTDSNVIYINIPRKVDMDNMELTEEQLEIIAGGGDPSAVLQGIADPLSGIVE